MFEIVFLISLSLYFIQSVIFIIGASIRFKKLDEDNLPSITIIVSARDEEENILDCLKSLDQSIYPSDKIEILIVNDFSADKTGQIIENFISDKPKFKCLLPEKAIGSLKGKANAIANAIKVAQGEVILTTDADCIVAPTWAKTIASYYKDDVAIVCGYTDQFSKNAFEAMQSLDFIYLLAVAAGAMNLGKPLSCIGNNMSYRKSVYDEIGGYENVPFSVTEDFQVLMAIHKLKKYKIIYPLDKNALVTSKPCPDVTTLFWQKKRWGVGGLNSDFAGFFVTATAFITHICMLLTPFFFSTTALYIFSFKIITDYFFMFPFFNKLNLKFPFKHFVAFEIYFLFYVTFLPFALAMGRKIKWKGRHF